MRLFIIILLLLIKGFPAIAQNPASDTSMQYFVALYTTGSSWDASKLFYEQTYFNDHSEHLASLRKAGKITIGGRYSDTGLILIKASNETEAQKFVNDDPAIRNKLFKVSVFPFDAFYGGCIE